MIRVSLCQRNKARHIMTWYARIFDTETKSIRYESLGTTKKTEASDLMQERKARGSYERKAGSMNLGSAFSLYLKSLEQKGCSPDTLRIAESSLMSLAPLYGLPVDRVTKSDLMKSFNDHNEGISPSTYNTRKQYVKTAFRFIVGVLELIPASPAECLKSRKSTSPERDFWTMDQVERIIAAAPDPMHRLLWSLMAFAGFRIHEAMKARPDDVRDGYIYVLGKGRKYAKVPISSRLQKELDAVGMEWDFSGLNQWIYALQKAARTAIPEGFNGMANNHRFRHSFASNLIRSGASIKAVQKLMRHANIQTTLNIYSHLIDEDLSNEVEKMFDKSLDNDDNIK